MQHAWSTAHKIMQTVKRKFRLVQQTFFGRTGRGQWEAVFCTSPSYLLGTGLSQSVNSSIVLNQVKVSFLMPVANRQKLPSYMGRRYESRRSSGRTCNLSGASTTFCTTCTEPHILTTLCQPLFMHTSPPLVLVLKAVGVIIVQAAKVKNRLPLAVKEQRLAGLFG